MATYAKALYLFAILLFLTIALTLTNCSGGNPSSAFTPAIENPTGHRDVSTYHYDNARTGQNQNESTLTPANVNSNSFGKLNFFSVDGKVDAQPLYVSNVNVASALHNILYVTTEHGSVYAFDADTGALVWHASLLARGESPSDDHGCGQVTPEIGSRPPE